MEHAIPMERLPDGVQFPEELRDRIWFDAERHRLVFRGFMSKAEFDRLCQLNDDWSYRRPLEDLFRECSDDDGQPRRGGLRRMLAVFGI